MQRSRLLIPVVTLAVVTLLPGTALATQANNAAATYEYHMDVPNVAQAADGDTVEVTGMGTFSVHPKSADGGGTFTLTDDGTTLSGTWEATELLSFQPYGCGVALGDPLPENFCGGVVKMRVLLTASDGTEMEAILTIVCIIGDIPGQPFVSRNATEGILLDVPGVENYNKQLGGMNVFILLS